MLPLTVGSDSFWTANLVVDVSGSFAGASVAGSSTLGVDSVRPRACARRDTLPVRAASDSLLIDAVALGVACSNRALDPVFRIEGDANKPSRMEVWPNPGVARLSLASLPDSVLALVLRDLPRDALLRLRLTAQDVCGRVSMFVSDERVSRTLHFAQRLRAPDTLHDVPDVTAFLRHLCGRFGIKSNTWSLSLDVRVQADADSYSFSCSGASAREVLTAVEATPLDIQLTLSGAALGKNAGVEAFAPIEAFAPVLATVTRLVSLDLSRNGLGAAGAASLAPALSAMTQLTSLALLKNDLGAAGAASLAPALSTLTQLTKLNLGHNGLRAASLAPVLATLTQMTSLNLRG